MKSLLGQALISSPHWHESVAHMAAGPARTGGQADRRTADRRTGGQRPLPHSLRMGSWRSTAWNCSRDGGPEGQRAPGWLPAADKRPSPPDSGPFLRLQHEHESAEQRLRADQNETLKSCSLGWLSILRNCGLSNFTAQYRSARLPSIVGNCTLIPPPPVLIWAAIHPRRCGENRTKEAELAFHSPPNWYSISAECLRDLPVAATGVRSGCFLLAVDLFILGWQVKFHLLDSLRRRHSRLEPRFGRSRGPGRVGASLRQPEPCECSSSAVSSEKAQGRDAAARFARSHLCA